MAWPPGRKAACTACPPLKEGRPLRRLCWAAARRKAGPPPLDRFDTDKSIGRLLEESGYGNHPAVLRFFSRLADSLLEDSLPGSEGGGSLPPLEERMYAGWSSQRS